jgi:PAS domain S-box-containing protein
VTVQATAEESRSAGTTASRLLHGAGKALLVAAAYYLTARLGLRLALVAENVTPVWPATGIALVAFLVVGRTVWPGVALAAFLVNLPISTDALAAGITAVGNTLAPLVAAILLERVGFRREIDRLRDAVAIVFLGALASMLISATIGAGTLWLSDAIPASEFPAAWAVWWAGDAMGVLVVAPFLLSLLLPRERPASWPRRVEAAVLFGVLTAVSLAAASTGLGILFLVFPFLGWAAWRFQQRGAAPAALLAAGIASWAAANHLGPFEHGTLLDRMLTLQAFNATVAFSSLFFAAVVTDRMRARRALERAAAELEDRVRLRTSELSAAHEQLAEAQHVAHVGSWEWLVPENRVSWSDEMYRIHGYRPQEFPVTFEKAIELVVEEDIARIRRNLEAAFGRGRDQDLPANEYRIVLADGSERVLLGKARLQMGPDGKPLRMVGTVHDITEEKQAEREHRIAETLQRSLLPDRLPEIPGVALSARYVPATTDMEVGGDWYDVVQLPNGHVGLAIGDVAGHGLRAASTMGQLRMSLRAYALEEESPAAVVRRVHRLVNRLHLPEIVTLVYVVFDPDSGEIRFANAGHPPPLLIEPNGEASYLEEALAPPVGAVIEDHYVEGTANLASGSTLVLFTDGLVERRGVSISEGLARLQAEAANGTHDLEAFCDRVLASLVGNQVADDIALLAVRPVPLTGALRLRVAAEPHILASLRRTVRRWLREMDVEPEIANDTLIACGEALANVIQHAYGAGEGPIELSLTLADGSVEITVRDRGRWRPPSGAEGGRGLDLVRGLMDRVEVEPGPDGTVVRMRRRIRA